MKILLSDPHFAPFRNEKFLTQKRNIIEFVISLFAVLLQKKEEKIFIQMENAVRKGEIDLGIINGDFMESSRTERGMNTEKDLETAKRLGKDLKQRLGLKRIEFNAGNHESGYKLPLMTDEKAGVYLKSIQNFLCLAERDKLYHSFIAKGVKVILLPYILSEKSAVDFDLEPIKAEILDSLKKDLSSPESVVLFLHDPDSFMDDRLLDLVRESRNKVKFIFYGHYHSKLNLTGAKILTTIYNKWQWLFPRMVINTLIWVLSFGNVKMVKRIGIHFRERKNIPSIIKELGAILIPALTGMFGVGGGFLTLDMETNSVEWH